MSETLTGRMTRWGSIVAAVIVGAVLVYRGNTYVDPMGPGMLAPTMCVLAALSLIGTTLAMLMRSNASDADYEAEAAV